MGLTDKIAGRVKKTIGDITDNDKARQDGALQERKGEAADELEQEEKETERKAEEVAHLEDRA
ncbi:MAG: CsbD family protein [Solirubrobacteraceae bacterium]